ncbi:hypothetical protein F4859DRAFT_510106 [Xylaria cf. heliscus]|nr:hypothetical protein F4859DRAFT_510106 [Xylaria cf. heliscus]
MQLKAIIVTALLPLLAVADDSTLTSTMTMTKTITISKVATSSVYTNATSSSYQPIGTGYSTFLPTTTTKQGSGSATVTPTATPSAIDNGKGSGAASLSAFGFAGVAGMVLAALM